MSSEGVRTESLDQRDAEAAPSLRSGELVLDRYRVERPIGRGGMGEVYEATHVTLGSRVALKLPLGKSPSGKGAARLLREAQVAASLDPERVVRVLDVGVLGDGRPVIVLERLDGETLAERVSRHEQLDIVEAVDFTVGACLGLAEAHTRGIIHRDVKPSNLFLARRRDGSGIVKVLDFGVAALRATGERDDARLTDSRAPVGSPPYMAPEQLRARAVDARTDVWGLGVTLFELLTGRLPFDGPSPAAIAAAIVADPPTDLRELRPDLPDGLAAVVARCLTKSADGRPTDALSLARELAPFASSAERAQVLAASRSNESPEPLGQTSLVSARALSPSRPSATGAVTASPKLRPTWIAAGVAAAALLVWAMLRDPGKPNQAAAGEPASASTLDRAEPNPQLAVHATASAETTAALGPAAAPAAAPAASLPPAPEASASVARPSLGSTRSRPIVAASAATTAQPSVTTAPRIMDERRF